MYAELVYDGGSMVQLPQPMRPEGGVIKPDQFQGTVAEKLIEVCGRCCYDSFKSEKYNPSGQYHRNLILEQKHYSVPEQVHFTIDVMHLSPLPWIGIPDVAIKEFRREMGAIHYRLTANLRHVMEWPNNVTFECTDEYINQQRDIASPVHATKVWGEILQEVGHILIPSVIAKPATDRRGFWQFDQPRSDAEAFVSIFLEDSRVWSHEMVRHRGNMSQRSGRFVDETDRVMCIHPLFRDYLNDLGSLAGDDDDTDSLYVGGDPNMDDHERLDRSRIGDALASLTAQQKSFYMTAVDRLQKYAEDKKGLDKKTARKQARSAARYYLGNGLSTEMVFTASVRHWRHIFKQRVNPGADAAINELMIEAEKIVRASRYGHLL